MKEGERFMLKGQQNRRDFIQKATGAVGATLAARAIQLGSKPLAATSRPAGSSEAGLNSSAWFVRNDPLRVDELSQPQYDISVASQKWF
jgi:hypothetical protein